MRWTVPVVLLLVAMPAAGLGIDNPTQPTQVRLYPHLIGHADLPMNTQAPPESWSYTVNLGLVTHSQGCIEVPGVGLVSDTHHTFYAYATPALVDYGADGARQTPARGIHHDISIDPEALHFTWFMESDATPAMNTAAPAPVPQVTVRTTMRSGDAVSVDHEAMNTGRIIALGQTGPALLAGPATDAAGVTHSDSQGKDIYRFDIPLEAADAVPQILADEGFNLRVDIYMQVPGCDDPAAGHYATLDWVRAHTSAGHRPTLDLTIHEPVHVRSMEATIENGTLLVEAVVDTAWGIYNLGDVALAIEGPTATTSPAPSVHDPAPHQRLLGRTVLWSWPLEDATAGDYILNVTALDAQGNGPAVARLPFAFGDGTTTCHAEAGGEPLCHTQDAPGKGSPLPFWVLLAALAAVALRRRVQ